MNRRLGTRKPTHAPFWVVMPRRIATINGQDTTLPELVEAARSAYGFTLGKYFFKFLIAETLVAALYTSIQRHWSLAFLVILAGAIALVVARHTLRRQANLGWSAVVNVTAQMAITLVAAATACSGEVLFVGFVLTSLLSALYRNPYVALGQAFVSCLILLGFGYWSSYTPPFVCTLFLALETAASVAICSYFDAKDWQTQGEIFDNAEFQLPLPNGALTSISNQDQVPFPSDEYVEPPAFLTETTEIERNNRYASLVKNSSDAIIFHNLEGKITSWNLGAEQLLGYSEFEIKGKHLNTILPEDYRKIYWNHVSELRNFPRLPSFEVQFETREGDLIFVSTNIVEIAGTTGDTVNVSLTARDVTRQKEAESHVSDLYAMVSHELRTPLTSLRGSLALLDEGMVSADSDDGRTMIKIARQGTEKLLKIVNDILDVRKLEAGRMQFHREVVKVEELINQSVLGMQKFADSRNVRITIAVAEEAFVSADRERIIQVLTNFISNAVKHSDEGGEVQVHSVLRQSGNVRFAVVDSGKGIPFDKQATLFEKFHNIGHSSSPSSLTGPGLGLAICKSVVQQHEGTVGLISAEGKGSTFWFELKALGRAPRAGGTMVVDAIKHTLLVSDNDVVVQTMHKSLMKNGIGCRLISRAEDALPVTESVKPSAIFIDANFVGASLLDIIQSINQSAPNVHTIVYRSFADGDRTFSYPVSLRVVDGYEQLLKKNKAQKTSGIYGFLSEGDLPSELKAHEATMNADDAEWLAAATAGGLKHDANGKQLALVAADLNFLVHEKFAPLNGYPVEAPCTLTLLRTELTPADESFAILSILSNILNARLNEQGFLDELKSRV